MTHVTCGLNAKNGISSGTLCSAIEYGLPLPLLLRERREEGRERNKREKGG